jgi:Rps23 Pro-64 3,4-dihydroxylase Tpa1-like proline 4-hydroxylase
MDELIIIDNFLTDEELNNVKQILYSKKWGYGHNSGEGETITNKFFACYDLGGYFSINIKKKIEDTLKKKFNIDRMYSHIQTYSIDGSFHIDNTGENNYTVCLYIGENDCIINEKGGELIIKLPNKQHMISIDSYVNRLVFFPSYYYHKGLAYNRYVSAPRICIAYKLQLIDNN